MLRLIFSGTNIRQEGKKVIARGIYRGKRLPAPFEGERVVCENQTNGKKFVGRVIKVNSTESRFDIELDLSREAFEQEETARVPA